MIEASCLVSVQAVKRLGCETEEEASALLKTALQAAVDQIAEVFAEALRADGYRVSIQPEYITFGAVEKPPC